MRTEEYFARPKSYDVMFFGNSHMQEAVIPEEIFDEYGIASFNMSHPANLLPTSYWCIQNCFNYAKPKLVVLDGYLSSRPFKISDNNYSYTVHGTFDCFPLSPSKIKAAVDLYNDKAIAELQKKGDFDEEESRSPFDMLFKYSTYHSKWPAFNMSFLAPSRAEYPYGYSSSTSVADSDFYDEISTNSVDDDDDTGYQYIKKAIKSCRDNNVDILLVYLPFPAEESDWEEANTIEQISEEYGVNYINFLDMDVIDFETDMSDGTHLNPSGAYKVSDYLGEYIKKNYSISSGNASLAKNEHWSENREWYMDSRETELETCEDLDEYLMLLKCPQFRAVIYPDDDLKLEDSTIDLLENLGVSKGMLRSSTKITIEAGMVVEVANTLTRPDDCQIVVSDIKTGEIINKRNF